MVRRFIVLEPVLYTPKILRQPTGTQFLSNFSRAKIPTPRVSATQDPFEGLSKLRVEDGVNDRIQRRVKVPQPQGETHDVVADSTSVSAERHKQG